MRLTHHFLRPETWRNPGLSLGFVLAASSLLILRAESGPGNLVLRVVTPDPKATNLLANGGFEQRIADRPTGWSAAPQGFRIVDDEGRNGSGALFCVTGSGSDWSGASQTLTLNRREVAPLVVRGWSRAEDVSGGPDNGYALYVDLLYADGTPLWGQTATFHCGTHDWESRQFVIMPERPVKSLTLHCLLRGHTGRVWFDDVSVQEVAAGAGSTLFQGVPVLRTAGDSALPPGSGADSGLTNLAATGAFLARDAATNSDVFRFDRGAIPELGLKLTSETIPHSDHVEIQGRLTDTTGTDRAVTLVFALPIEASGWHWGDDLRRSRAIEGNGEWVNTVGIRCGATGTMSLYPVAPIWNERTGLALALDLGRPAVCRIGYHAGLKWLFIAYDFGLVKETDRFPASADFRFVVYRFEPRWGFRAAWEGYRRIFPGYFVVRAREQGLWMPFTDVSRVKGWEDFGFKFHEGNNNVPWDDTHGVLSFRYTEPMTWWMPMPKGAPRTPAEALRIRETLAAGPDTNLRELAGVSRLAAMQDDLGDPSLLFRNEPWCDGAVWSLNPNPHLGERAGRPATNAATIYWNGSIRETLYGPQAKGRLDGEYLDSLEGYVTAELNFRREHFRDTTVPLTFSTDTHQPALFKGLAVFEFTRWMADDVHGLGKLMFANGVPYRFAFLCPWLDVLGTETDWLQNDRYRPASIREMDCWRTLSGAKPYLLLMNTDYDRFTSDRVEQYFQRALFYGMWPGFFSHNASENPYWQNPKWYDRDRPLFRKYIPLIRRVAEAGWQTIPGATCDNPQVLMERFGAGRPLFLTLHNDTDRSQTGTVRVASAVFSLPHPCPASEPLTGKHFVWPEDGWPVSLEPQQTRVIALGEEP